MKTEHLMKFISMVRISVEQSESYRKALKQQKLESLIKDISELQTILKRILSTFMVCIPICIT